MPFITVIKYSSVDWEAQYFESYHQSQELKTLQHSELISTFTDFHPEFNFCCSSKIEKEHSGSYIILL